MPDSIRTILSIVPAHNEGESIANLVEQILEVEIPGFEIQVFVAEDGSSDSTRTQVLKAQQSLLPKRVVLSPESGRLGYSEAIRRAISSADTDYVWFLDGDGQLDPQDLNKLVVSLSPESQFVVGYRNPRVDTKARIAFSKLFGLAYRIAGGPKLKDPSSPFLLIPTKLAKEITGSPAHLSFGFWWEFQIRAKHLGITPFEVPIPHYNRDSGATRVYSLKKLPGIVYSHLVGLYRLREELSGSKSR
jgi:glycosyltransferase involved in cell wall biosynthesis